jgi:hypothetical protein
MLELMKLGDIVQTQKGVVFAGVNEKFEGVSYSVIRKILDNVININYISCQGTQMSDRVLNIDLHPSIGNNFNIFLLLGEYDIKNSPKKGESIYCQDNEELSVVLNPTFR